VIVSEMALARAKKWQSYREQRVRDANEIRRQAYLQKDRERHRKYKQLVKDILAKRKWKQRKQERKRPKKLEQLAKILPAPTPSTDAMLLPR